MRDLGHVLVKDYKLNQLGIQDHYAGANMVDGQRYCPEMSQAMVEADRGSNDQWSTPCMSEGGASSRITRANRLYFDPACEAKVLT